MAIPVSRRQFRLSVFRNSVDFATPYSEQVAFQVPCQFTAMLDTASIERSDSHDISSIRAKALVDLPFLGSSAVTPRSKAVIYTVTGVLVGDFTISDVLNTGRSLLLVLDRFAT